MLNILKQHYNISHVFDKESISLKFYEYYYQVFTDDWKLAIFTNEGIEIYDSKGESVSFINLLEVDK